MVHIERHFFSVRERRGGNKLIQLEGQIIEPATPSEGRILFTQGTGRNKELAYYTGGSLGWYGLFLGRLAEEGFTVITFNRRGHGQSEGIPTSDGTLDLEGILSSPDVKGKGKVALVGHSVGAAASLQAAHDMPELVSSVYCINPFLGLAFDRRAGGIPPFAIPVVKGAVQVGLAAYLLMASGLYRASGSERDDVRKRTAQVRSAASRISVPSGGYAVPVAFALSAEDEIIGTLGNAGRHSRLIAEIEQTVPGAFDFSPVLENPNLNHYLNRGLRNSGSFFAGDADNRIYRSISWHVRSHAKAR